MRLAAVGDLHVKKTSQGQLQPLLASVNEHADVLLLCGDLTDYGLPEEAIILAKELNAVVRIPIVAVLGNHDYRVRTAGRGLPDSHGSGREGARWGGLRDPRGRDRGRERLLGRLRAGDPGRLGRACDQTLRAGGDRRGHKLEGALARLRTERRIALLHYSPIRATVENEPLEIMSYLGTSRLEEPINRYPVDVVFHGHAHHGSLEGRTSYRHPGLQRGNAAVVAAVSGPAALPVVVERRRLPTRLPRSRMLQAFVHPSAANRQRRATEKWLSFATSRRGSENSVASPYIERILKARVYDVAIESPLDEAPRLSRRIGNRVMLKREDLQPVFSFKVRGAYNRIAHLSEAAAKRGVVCASAGNHAQGVALAAKRRGIPAVIVMPQTTPHIKVQAVIDLRCGARDPRRRLRQCVRAGAGAGPGAQPDLRSSVR